MKPVKITLDHLEQIVKISSHVWEEEYAQGRCTEADVQQFSSATTWIRYLFNPDVTMFGVFENGTLLGYMGYDTSLGDQFKKGFLYKGHAAVHIEHRGKGIYKTLNQHIEEEAKRFGYPGVVCATFEQSPARPSLEKNGYTTEEITFYCPPKAEISTKVIIWTKQFPH